MPEAGTHPDNVSEYEIERTDPYPRGSWVPTNGSFITPITTTSEGFMYIVTVRGSAEEAFVMEFVAGGARDILRGETREVGVVKLF